MLDLATREWTDKEGKVTSLKRLESSHLVNIREFLRRLVKNKDDYIARRRAYWYAVARQYDAEYCDKDWYYGDAFNDVEDAGKDDYNRLKIALMLVSEETRRRGFK